MSVDLTAVASEVKAVINAARAVYGTVDNPLWFDAEITEAVKAAALGVMMAIFDTPNHRYRTALLEMRAVSDGDQVKGAIGAFLLDGQKATFVKASKLRRFKLNRLSIDSINDGGYYCIEGHVVNFITGAGTIETLKDLSGSDFDVPNEFEVLVIAGALMIVFPKQGSNVAASEDFREFYMEGLKLIHAGATTMPAMNPYQTIA